MKRTTVGLIFWAGALLTPACGTSRSSSNSSGNAGSGVSGGTGASAGTRASGGTSAAGEAGASSAGGSGGASSSTGGRANRGGAAGTAGGEGGTLGGEGGGSGNGGAPGGDACIEATVIRAPGDTQQPWIKWPTFADGVGTLVVSASRDGAVSARVTAPNADMRSAQASYVVELGCPGPGTYVLRAFLDDNGNATAMDVTSTDYRDSCMGGTVPESVGVTVASGRTARAELALYQSCDPTMD